MASIADTFLADFESSGDEDEEEGQEEEEEKEKKKDKKDKAKEEEVEPEVLPEPEALDEVEVNDLDVTLGLVESTEADAPKEELKVKMEDDTVAAISVLLNDSELKTHLEKIANLMASTETEMGIHLNVDREEEYDVIVRSNELVVEIDNEIATIHKYIRDIYSTKYHELEIGRAVQQECRDRSRMPSSA
eukprot:TRINITY_DN17676_c0_g2_i1.p1 TRINITY_DN17676_c0_g2~~TRINITY_DN17676_c0_g2_i1.p1  ORF type:complete len:190 (-),score=52.24 TRINITY_DN17676_c0_g2_i1:11-580(-)